MIQTMAGATVTGGTATLTTAMTRPARTAAAHRARGHGDCTSGVGVSPPQSIVLASIEPVYPINSPENSAANASAISRLAKHQRR